MITVKTILNSSLLQRCEVLAGKTGLNRDIRTVTVIDTPVATKMLMGGEVVLTTGYILGDDPQAFVEFVRTLITEGTSSLGVKLGRYLSQVPECVLKLAEENSFPIFTIPLEIVWSEIITLFHDLRLSLISSETLFNNDVAKFEQMVLFGSHNINTVCQNFVNMIGIAAVIVDCEYKIITSNGLDGCDEILTYINRIMESKVNWPPAYSQQAERVDDYWIAEIVLSSSEHLILASLNRILSRNVMQLLQALYTMSTRKTERKMERAAKMERFIETVLTEAPEAALAEAAATLFPDQLQNYCMAVISGPKHTQMYKHVIESMKKKETAAKWEVYGLARMIEREHVLFCKTVARRLIPIEALSDLRSLLGGLPFDEVSCSIYVGTITDSPRTLRESYRRARAAQRIASVLWPDCRAFFANDMDILGVMQRDNIKLDEIDYLRQKITSFDACATLEVYLENDSVKKAAEKVFIHENTMRYRLFKISSLLQMDLRDPMNRLNLLARIKLWKINNN